MELERSLVRQVWASDRRQTRRGLICSICIAAAVFLICISFRYGIYDADVFIPGKYYHVLLTRIEIGISGVFKGSVWHEREALQAAIGDLDWVGAGVRLDLTAMAAASGAGLAVAGAIFQTIYKNPLASPNMLGATAGVQMGNVLMVMLFSQSALVFVLERYTCCYLLTAICVAIVLVLGKLAGDRTGNPSVLKMVMAGSIINQGIGTVAMYLMYQLPEEDLLVFQELMMGTNINTKNISLLIFFAVMAMGLIPMLLLRYRFNVTGIDDAEAKVAGVNPAPYRLLAQVFGILMVTAAMIHCGEAGMLSMVIPYIVRHRIGSDSRKLIVISALYGAVLLMICRTISTTLLVRDSAGDILLDANGQVLTIPVTFFVNICLLPFFMVILARQRSAFE